MKRYTPFCRVAEGQRSRGVRENFSQHLCTLSPLLIWVLLPSLLCGTPMSPSLSGAKGLYRLLAADNGYPGLFHVRTAINGFTADLKVDYLKNDTIIQGGAVDTYLGGDVDIGIAFVPWEFLELNGNIKFFVDAIDCAAEEEGVVDRHNPLPEERNDIVYNGWENRVSYGWGDMFLGTKFIVSEFIEEWHSPINFALYSFLSLPTGPERDTVVSLYEHKSYIGRHPAFQNAGGVFRYFTSGATGGGIALLLSYTTPTTTPISTYLNLGYWYRGKGTLGDEIIYGVGLDALFFEYFDPFIELWGSKRSLTQPDPFGQSPPTYLTLGTKFITKRGMSFDVGFDILTLGRQGYNFENFKTNDDEKYYHITKGWGGRPAWRFNLSAAFSYDFYKLAPPTRKGMIAGRIIDESTNEGIDAVVSVPGSGFPSIMSYPGTGVYNVEVEPGKFRVVVSKEGYYGKSKFVEVRIGRTTTADFKLRPKPTKSVLTGKIIDKWSGKELKGISISLSQREVVAEPFRVRPSWNGTATSDSTGLYNIDSIVPGTYLASITIEGYVSQTVPVVCKPNETTILNIELLPKIITLRGVHFEFNKSNLLVDSYLILRKVVDFLSDNPDIIVEVAGHTDSIGSDEYNTRLSQRRANQVSNYLITHGIKPTRITAIGYGESMPIADNSTSEGRALNRRTELWIRK